MIAGIRKLPSQSRVVVILDVRIIDIEMINLLILIIILYLIIC